MATTTHRLLGVNDEADTCSQCGRRNLKRVAWLAELDADGNIAGDAAPFGTDCAGAILYDRKDRKNTDLVRAHGEAMSTARRWLAAGHAADVVAKGIWNRYGYSTTARETGVEFYLDGARILVTAAA